jgi:hypothetical protein
MSKGNDEIIEKITREVVAFCNSRIWHDGGYIQRNPNKPHIDSDLLDTIAKILNMETDTLRIAIVRKKPELPDTPNGDPYDDYANGYIQSQEDVLSAGFVQEEKLQEVQHSN